MISKVMNGYSQDMDQWQASLHALRSEMRLLDRALYASELYAPTRAVLGENASVEAVRRAAVDTLEDCALSIVVETFERAGSLCVGRIFDGAHQLKCASDGRALDLPAIALAASAAVEAALGIALVARVKPFELPFDADNDEYCESVDEALTADVLFAEDEHPRPTKVCDIVDLVIERFFGKPWIVLDKKRILLVRDINDHTWSEDKYAFKEYANALDGQLGLNPRCVRLYDELADYASKHPGVKVSRADFADGYMMRHPPHLLPFAHGQMLDLDTGAHMVIAHEQRVWDDAVLNWPIPAPGAHAALLHWTGHYLAESAPGKPPCAWMPPTYAVNARHVALRSRFEPPGAGETELQCIARDVVALLQAIFGPLRDTVLDRVAPAFFERKHNFREFIVLTGAGAEGKSLLFALLRLVAPALVVKAEALVVGKRGLSGNNESWERAARAAIVVTEEADGMLDGNAYKELSGGNGVSISCSRKYAHDIETKFRGLVVLLTNSRLDFKPFDGALADRLLAMRMPSKFVRTPDQARAAYGQKAHVKVYAAFENEQYVQALFEKDHRYRAALIAALYAHYRARKGQYAALDPLYDGKQEYAAECASTTPAGAFDAFWRVDKCAEKEGRTATELFNEMKMAAGTEDLQWKNPKSLGCFLKQRFNGGLGCLPHMVEGRSKCKLWYGFARVEDE
mmetsp:Transcript_17284/g.43015  ORF Transcript_17284/g.43015 Transcript_17284/m.43015 type:complete len:685 (-) Transcript_17284:223-2277(-)